MGENGHSAPYLAIFEAQKRGFMTIQEKIIMSYSGPSLLYSLVAVPDLQKMLETTRGNEAFIVASSINKIMNHLLINYVPFLEALEYCFPTAAKEVKADLINYRNN